MTDFEASIVIEGVSKKYLLNRKTSLSFRDAISNVFSRDKGEVFWALNDVTLTINRGEVFGIIGKNGAGKSTLLKILSKITPPTKGRIEINGSLSSLLEVGTGFHPELSGKENIFLNGTILGMTRKEIKSKLDEIIEFSGVEKFINNPVKHYSSGMYVRLAFSVAAHLDPDILIIDEVLAVGDYAFQKKCLGKMNEVSKLGRTIIFVSHDLSAISRLCERAALMKDGKIVMVDKTEITVNKYLNIANNSLVSLNLRDFEKRGGNGKAKFSFVSIHNTSNLNTNMFSIGDDIVLKFTVERNDTTISSCKLAIKITDSKGNPFVFSISEDSGIYFTDMNDKNFFEVILTDIRFYPDDYYITLISACNFSTELYDEVSDCLSFSITDGGKLTTRPLPKSQANFFITPNWKRIYA